MRQVCILKICIYRKTILGNVIINGAQLYACTIDFNYLSAVVKSHFVVGLDVLPVGAHDAR